MERFSHAISIRSIAFLLFLFLLSSPYVSAADLSPLALFHRCYERMTGQSVPLNHPYVSALRGDSATAQDAIDACMHLLEQATFNTSGVVVLDPANPDGSQPLANNERRGVLKTFDDFHRSAFLTADDINFAFPDYFDGFVSSDLMDQTEPTQYFNRALFQCTAFGADNTCTQLLPFSSVVDTPVMLEAVRENMPTTLPANAPVSGFTPAQFRHWPERPVCPPGTTGPHPTCYLAGDPSYERFTALLNGVTFNPFISSGALLGVRLLDSNNPRYNLNFRARPLGGDGSERDVFLNRSIGGYGLLGSRVFGTVNFGYEDGVNPNGALKMPRRLTKALFHTLLCRDTPPLRPTQVLQYVNPSQSLPAFRNGSSCLTCHVPYDWVAALYRNQMQKPATLDFDGNNHKDIVALGTLPVNPAYPNIPTAPNEPYWPWGGPFPDYQFQYRPPQGRALYNSIDGTVIDTGLITGLAGFSATLIANRDMYACTAARYLKFFTGLDVDTRSEQEILSNELTAEDVELRQLMFDLGDQLRTDQNLQNLVRRILEHPRYRQENFGAGGGL